MDNPKKFKTLGTQDTERRQTLKKIQYRKLKKNEHHGSPPKNWGETSYETPTMLLTDNLQMMNKFVITRVNYFA